VKQLLVRLKLADPLKERIKELGKEAENIQRLQAPPSPYQFDDLRYSDTECLEMAEKIFSRWLSILRRDPECLTNLDTKGDVDMTWRELSFAMAYRFAPLLLRVEKLLLPPQGSFPGGWWPFHYHGIHGYENLCTAEYGFDAAVERRLLSEFLGGIWHAYFMTIVGSPTLGHTPQGWDEFIYMTFSAINEVSLASGKREHLLLGSLLSRALATRCEKAARERDRRDFELRNSASGSLVAVEELSQLASRSVAVIERYGKSEVETRFETQLALLMQSFGFLVVRTERAQRRVDLVCIAPGPAEEAYTILLEAKTTAANYVLPTKDSRAIVEYVSSVRSALKTLPPLRLVVVVGSTPAKTVAAKIGELEAACRLPVRYCDVVLLQLLRRHVPGPVDYSQFLKACIAAGRVLGSHDMRKIVESDKVIRSAHNDFVQTLLARSSENHS
jgi:hypothetical protein